MKKALTIVFEARGEPQGVNGSPMKAATFIEKLYDLSITPSYSRPRVSNDNAFAESAFKTLKYRPGSPVEGFATLVEAQGWVQQFTEWYNHEHRHSALRYVTPSQCYNGEAKSILEQRRKVLKAAKQHHPERWSGDIRKLSLSEIVHLNPERDPVPQAAGF